MSSDVPGKLIEGASPSLYNSDLAPTTDEGRTWGWTNIAALWVGMVVCVPTYMLTGGMISAGMNWYQAVGTVFLGNLIVLVPMILIGHAGTKHGIPFPVLLRSSFGTKGANIPAILRGLVACGWFGIQTWIGGFAIYTLLNIATDNSFVSDPLPILGINAAQLMCFLAFWAVHVWFIAKGTESIRWLETYAAPFLIAMGLLLLAWAYVKADGFGNMLSTPSQFGPGGAKEGQFWSVFVPQLTAMVGFWATLALNMPDFTRYAATQDDQIKGQAIGLPPTMALFAFIGVAVTSATVVIYGGEPISDPVKLMGKMGGMSVIVALLALSVATLTTNLAANVVAPANGFANLNPEKISFKMGGYITAGLGIAIFPWKLLAGGAYVFTWLIGYSALLGPIAGILIADYFLVRRTELDVDDLFREDGQYSFSNGWNPIALIALFLAVLPNVPGFLKQVDLVENVPGIFTTIYSQAWFVGLFIAILVYTPLMKKKLSQK
jgi:nucleobase:cation symporter-1, NCS1 family